MLCAVDDEPIGIDIEEVKNIREHTLRIFDIE